MRIGEVLKLRPEDIDGVKVTLWHPKSGNDREMVFIPRLGAGVGLPQNLELVVGGKLPPHRFRHDFYPQGLYRRHSHTTR